MILPNVTTILSFFAVGVAAVIMAGITLGRQSEEGEVL